MAVNWRINRKLSQSLPRGAKTMIDPESGAEELAITRSCDAETLATRQPVKHSIVQIGRFATVGVLNTAFGYGAFVSLVTLGLDYVLANFIALLLGIAFSFRTQGAWVFGNRAKRLWLRFTVCWAAIFVFNIGCIAALMHAGLDVYLAGAVALMPSTIMSYFVQKFLVFGSPRRRLGVNTRS